jgi:hypothetical protein
VVVTTQSNGREDFGLLVGAVNARRYFPRSVDAVELRLDDLRIQCRLPASFWDGHPEIHDPRLREWLKFKVLREKRDGSPVALHMVQSGANTFTLRATLAAEKRAARVPTARDRFKPQDEPITRTAESIARPSLLDVTVPA